MTDDIQRDWGSLPADLLHQILHLLLDDLRRGGLLPAKQTAQLFLRLRRVCRQWRQALPGQLNLALRCSMDSEEDWPCVNRLAGMGATLRELRCKLINISGSNTQRLAPPGLEMFLLTDIFQEKIGPRLEVLAGVSSFALDLPQIPSLAGACCRSLRSLHVHGTVNAEELLVGGPAWCQLLALRELAVTVQHCTTVTLEDLPPGLRQLTVTCQNIFIDIKALATFPAVQIAAQEVYLVPNTPEENIVNEAVVLPLIELVRAVAAVGMPSGHMAELNTQAIWYKLPSGEPAWLHALFASDEEQQAAEVPQAAAINALHQQHAQQHVQEDMHLQQAGQQAAGGQAPTSEQQGEPPLRGPGREGLPSLLPSPPPDVIAWFQATEPPRPPPLVVEAGNVRGIRVQSQPQWPLPLYRYNPSMAAMRLTLHAG